VQYDNNEKKMESIYSKRIRAGKRRTYFFDVKATRGNDYYLTITESRKRFNDNGYDRHKIFLYKEDFNKFIKALTEAVDYVKTDLMPDFNFDAFNHDETSGDQDGEYGGNSENGNGSQENGQPETHTAEVPEPEMTIQAESPVEAVSAPVTPSAQEEVDKW
jgi:hypothetical protein